MGHSVRHALAETDLCKTTHRPSPTAASVARLKTDNDKTREIQWLTSAGNKEKMNQNNSSRLQVGKYLVSPLTRPLPDGRFSAGVSIRSGRGSNTTDRIMRFIPSFLSAAAADRYATAEGLRWIGATA